MVVKLIDSLIGGAINAVDTVMHTRIKMVDKKMAGTIETVDHAMDSVFSMKNKFTPKDGERILGSVLSPLDGIESTEDLAAGCEDPTSKD